MMGLLYIALIIWAAISAISLVALFAIYTHHHFMEQQRNRVLSSLMIVDAPEGARPA